MDKKGKIALIRKEIHQNRYPLEYKKNFTRLGTNCYAYAIGSSYKDYDGEKDYIYNLGTMSNMQSDSIENAEKAFIADMKVLGIKVNKSFLEEPISEGEWKVIMFFDDWPEDDFHFARQDADGNWSNKEYLDGPIRCLGNIPEYCTHLNFVSYYKLKVQE